MNNMKTALLLGATGLVGSHLLELLLQDQEYERVTIFVRNQVETSHSKLRQIALNDFQQMTEYETEFLVEDVFCCLGTTIKKAKTKERFKQVDFTYPLLGAELAKKAGVKRYLLISSMGADVQSRFFYNRVKGETEKAIQGLGLPSFLIFRPSLLLGKRKEFRLGEKLSAVITQPLSFLFKGILFKFHPIPAKEVALVMHKMAQTYLPGTQIFENDQILKLVPKNS